MRKILNSLIIGAIFCVSSEAVIIPSSNPLTPPDILKPASAQKKVDQKPADQKRLKALFGEYSQVQTNIYGKIGARLQDPEPVKPQPSPVNPVKDNTKKLENPEEKTKPVVQNQDKPAENKNDAPAAQQPIVYPDTPAGRLAKILAQVKANKANLPASAQKQALTYSEQTNSTIPVTQITVEAHQNIYDELEIVKTDVAHSQDSQPEPLQITAYVGEPDNNAVGDNSVEAEDGKVENPPQEDAPADGPK